MALVPSLRKSGHPGYALAEVIVGIGEGVAQVPAVPVGHELVEKSAIDDGVLAGGVSKLLVVPRQPHQVDGAAHAVLGEPVGLVAGVDASAGCGSRPRRAAAAGKDAGRPGRSATPRRRDWRTLLPVPSQPPLLSMTMRVSSSLRTKRQGGEGLLARRGRWGSRSDRPHMTMLGWLRSRLTIARVERLNRSTIFGDRLHEPARVVLLVHHQADLVAQLDLVARRQAGERTDHVHAHDLAVQQVAAGQVGIEGHGHADGRLAAGVGALQEKPLAVEAEIAVFQAEIAESAARRMFVEAKAIASTRSRPTVTRYR